MTRTPAPVAWPSRPDLAAGGTLPAAWAAGWRAQPGRVAVLAPDATLTNADLEERTAAVAGRLHRAGVRSGDRVIVSGAASAALVVAHCAVLRLGAVVVPVNPAYTAREVGVIVGDATPAAAIVDDPA